ncbi:neutral zinc metallopeptidase [Brevundimonas sp. NPDC092305]|uniref:KPN_02809 family neutral zinc metallopeptidase n=1 Tax=Brevundimonas sp. NPDC092305 TaxID=3363957 RepID=UPI003804BE67
MEWRGGRRGGNIEDRRGMGPVGMAGGGIGALVVGAVLYFVFGIDPQTTQQITSQLGGVGGEQQAGQVGSPQDDAGQFVDVIGANIDDVWKTKLSGYTPPRVVLYEQGTGTGCGMGQAAMGPFYCPSDQRVYLDLSFWDQMRQLGGSDADFAKAYVIAHEFGHHVQTLTGASQQVRQAQQRAAGEAEANRYSVALELQADCYAGVWAANAAGVSNGAVSLQSGDLEQGMQTANAIGDDTLQRRSQGRVVPEGFTHGTSAQRMEWLKRGYQSGDPAVCDTFQSL